MEKLYACEIYLEYDNLDNIIQSIFKYCSNNFGFSPMYMTIHSQYNKFIEDVIYDKDLLISKLDTELLSLDICNKLYDENDGYYIFKMKVERAYNIISICWTNSNLEFLLKNGFLKKIIKKEIFLCGYCYDSNDVFYQSTGDIKSFKKYFPKENFETTKDEFGDKIIDIYRNWGREEFVCGVGFMAAPIMWFGNLFYKILSKEELLKFPKSTEDENYITINLFDLYDLPSKKVNRKLQKEFWTKLNLSDYIREYQNKKAVDPKKSLEDLVNRLRKK